MFRYQSLSRTHKIYLWLLKSKTFFMRLLRWFWYIFLDSLESLLEKWMKVYYLIAKFCNIKLPVVYFRFHFLNSYGKKIWNKVLLMYKYISYKSSNVLLISYSFSYKSTWCEIYIKICKYRHTYDWWLINLNTCFLILYKKF